MPIETTPVFVSLQARVDAVKIPLRVTSDKKQIPLKLGTDIVAGSAEPYAGEYEVTPLANVQTVLETEGKRLEKKVIVKEIPYQQVSNLSGGYTATIGG